MAFVTLLPVYSSGLAKAGDDSFNVTWGSCNEQFVIEIQFEHPYWDSFHADMGGPTFDNSNPYVDDYLCSYEEKTKVMGDLAMSFMKVAFPDAPARTIDPTSGGSTAGTASAPVDSVNEIKRYKALLDQGIITEEEFNAKKRQLMGI